MAKQKTELNASLTSRGVSIRKKIDALERHSGGVLSDLDKYAMPKLIEIGSELLAVQVDLANHGDGTFNRFISEAVGTSVPSAYRYMGVATFLKDRISLIESFDRSAIYLLSAETAPEAAETEAVERAEAGEKITPKIAKEIIKRHSDPVEEATEVDEDAWLVALKEPYKGFISKLNEIIRDGDKLVASEDTGTWLSAVWPAVKVSLKSAKGALSQVTPHAECPYCKRKGCKQCRTAGWMGKFAYESLPMEDRE